MAETGAVSVVEVAAGGCAEFAESGGEAAVPEGEVALCGAGVRLQFACCGFLLCVALCLTVLEVDGFCAGDVLDGAVCDDAGLDGFDCAGESELGCCGFPDCCVPL